jgi:hypothetical protein
MAKKERTGIEWIGGIVSMPAYVTGEGDPYRSDALFWMGAEGAVLDRHHRQARRAVRSLTRYGAG